ncbi:hypothetical protein [Acidovorax sp. SUPP2825]|uniref:hypothetical protein n=1 Tax=Acidovorax sp. SUPP2825 TaxID=2920879 RepID=UPI0023DE67A3|nr:hypothetical protein [Acidovorax sp. SUPP2825]GKS96155.1 hypothetical protein AVAK2825_16490 [Acidovorax sp. SUPP2825]
MIEVHAYTFYGLIVLGAMGMLRAAWDVWGSNQGETGFLQKPNAPAGHEWVLMTERDAEEWRSKGSTQH